MKIFVVCSTKFYNKVEQVEKILKQPKLQHFYCRKNSR